MMVDPDIENLLVLLNQQKSALAELTELAGEQLEALKQDDLDKLKNITLRQEYVGRHSAALEQKRGRLMQEFSRKFGVEIRRFAELKAFVGEDEFTKIKMLRDELVYSSRKLKREHELNAMLLKQGLQYTDKMLRVLNVAPAKVYDKSGDIRRTGDTRVLDTNI